MRTADAPFAGGEVRCVHCIRVNSEDGCSRGISQTFVDAQDFLLLRIAQAIICMLDTGRGVHHHGRRKRHR
jgi:hypothetical protein